MYNWGLYEIMLKLYPKNIVPLCNPSTEKIQKVLNRDVLEGKKILIVTSIDRDPISCYTLFSGEKSESISYRDFFSKPKEFSSDVLIFNCTQVLASKKRQSWVADSLRLFRKSNPDSLIFLGVDNPEMFKDLLELENSKIVDALDRTTESGEHRLLEKARRILELRQAE